MQNPVPRVQPVEAQIPSVPAPPTPGIAVPAGDLAAMQGRLAELRAQEVGLKAQWNALRRQLEAMRSSNTARPGVSQEWADVGSQLAKVQGEADGLSARIAQAEGRSVPGTVVPGTPPPRRTGPDPDMVVGLAFVVAIVILLPMSIAMARRMWRGRPQPTGPKMDELSPRFDRLEQAIDAIAIEVERISEGQRFVTKIMAERPVQTPASQPEAKPLVLGAGPVEPVKVGERQAEKEAVRKRVTPL